MSKTFVRFGLCALLLALLVPAFAGAVEAPVPMAAVAKAADAARAEALAKAVVANLFQVKSASCPAPQRKADDVGVTEIIEGPVKEGPINLAACGNCQGTCNSDPGCAGKVLGDPCDPNNPSLTCVTQGAGCKAFNCCTCGY